MEKKKIGFFFGAGAEVSYGLPLGGNFALDIFRTDTGKYKKELETVINNINRGSNYATEWLPDSYYNKRIFGFGKPEFTTIFESSLEYRKDIIIKLLNNFDDLFVKALNKLSISQESLAIKFKEYSNKSIGEKIYSQLVKLNPAISKDIKLFESEYYSAILELLQIESVKEKSSDLTKYGSSFLQLLVASYGNDLIQKLNQEIFTEAPNDISIFDDLSGIFKIEYSNAGLSSLDILLKDKKNYTITDDSCCIDLFIAISHSILEEIFSQILDYQSLIDNHFRYLFSPKKEWAKFTKMVIFLKIVRDYIKSKCLIDDEGLALSNGYYNDIVNTTIFEVSVIGTSNYNNLVERIFQVNGIKSPNVLHLNGGINDFYDPFKNKLLTLEDDNQIPNDIITVPFIFTQSGLKPLTSIEMSRRYVELFDGLNNSDLIVVIGFGFNSDDCHINGLFRELIEDNNKKIIIILPDDINEDEKHKEILKKIRITKSKQNINIIKVNSEREINDMNWLEFILKDENYANTII